MEHKYFLKFVSCEKRKSKENDSTGLLQSLIKAQVGEILVERMLSIPGSGYKILQWKYLKKGDFLLWK